MIFSGFPILTIMTTDIRTLYATAFPRVARLVKNQGGDLEQAKDIFHDALIIYLERLGQPGFVIHASPVAYIMGTARLLAIKAFHQRIDPLSPTEMENALSIPEDFYAIKEINILDHVRTVGGKCLALLKAFYYENLDMQGIAQRFGFKTSRSATVQKFKCLERIREEVKNTALYEEVVA